MKAHLALLRGQRGDCSDTMAGLNSSGLHFYKCNFMESLKEKIITFQICNEVQMWKGITSNYNISKTNTYQNITECFKKDSLFAKLTT